MRARHKPVEKVVGVGDLKGCRCLVCACLVSIVEPRRCLVSIVVPHKCLVSIVVPLKFLVFIVAPHKSLVYVVVSLK